MKKICALVIDDKVDIAEAVSDRLASLGHICVHVSCQEEAREAIYKQRFDYILLDLEIPVRPGRGVPRIQNGENLLEEIQSMPLQKGVPVIVMSGHGTDSPSLAVQMMKKGASDYVTKPFPETGNTLEKAIRDALARTSSPAPVASEEQRAEAPAGIISLESKLPASEMIFEKESVFLWGIQIAGELISNQERIALDVIRVHGPIGGAELAAGMGSAGGENSAATIISRMRKKHQKIFGAQSGWPCNPDEIVLSGGRGYRFNECISVIDRTEGARYVIGDVKTLRIRNAATRK